MNKDYGRVVLMAVLVVEVEFIIRQSITSPPTGNSMLLVSKMVVRDSSWSDSVQYWVVQGVFF